MQHIFPVKEGTLMKFKHAHAAFTDRIFSIKPQCRNLGVIFDKKPNSDRQVKSVIQSSSLQLGNITEIRSFCIHQESDKNCHAGFYYIPTSIPSLPVFSSLTTIHESS